MSEPSRNASEEQPRRAPIPTFATEDEERMFWAPAASSDYVDWDTARRADLPSLKPSIDTSV